VATWSDVVGQVIAGYRMAAEQQPDLVAREVVAGSKISFQTSHPDTGAIWVTIEIPIPMEPPAGMLSLQFHDPIGTSVDLPQPPSGE
jgi:hypothetical protein